MIVRTYIRNLKMLVLGLEVGITRTIGKRFPDRINLTKIYAILWLHHRSRHAFLYTQINFLIFLRMKLTSCFDVFILSSHPGQEVMQN